VNALGPPLQPVALRELHPGVPDPSAALAQLAAAHRALWYIRIQEAEMKIVFVLCALLAASSIVALAGEWQGYLMDSMCAAKMRDKASTHKAKCALNCSKGGYGLVTADGKYIKFDEAGNARALAALKSTAKTEDLKAKVTGTMNGDMIQVESIVIQ
jgi:hypothetical protein